MIDNPFSMVAVIMICVTAMAFFKHRAREKNAAPDAKSDHELEALRREVYALTQRVKTLETLATDPEEKLKREFERL